MPIADNPDTAPIFIVGYIHTGTTLLQRVLQRDPELLVLKGETHFIQDIERIKHEFPNLQDDETRREYALYLVKLAYIGFQRANWYRDDYSLADIEVTDAQFEDIAARVDDVVLNTPQDLWYETAFSVVNDDLASFDGQTRWLEKTPQHVFFVDRIVNLWPYARVINLVRDPRAAIASRKIRRSDEWMERKVTANPDGTDKYTNFDPLIDSYVWKEAVNAGHEAELKFPDSVLTVRYEDLVFNPEETVRKICEFTGLPFKPEMLEIGWINSATHTTEGEKPQGISAAAVDKWKKVLSPEEVFVCQQALRKEMDQLGYDSMPSSLEALAKSPIVLGRSASNLVSRFWGQPERLQHRRKDAGRRIYRRALKGIGVQK